MSGGQEKGTFMAAEAADALPVFARAARADHSAALGPLDLGTRRALYTIARGSSDAAANILAYEMMRETGLPVTSLPPSVFSVGRGVAMEGAAALVISQSGASEDLVRSARGARARGAAVLALVNADASPVAAEAHVTLPIGAGLERAVPATKSVTGAIGAGMAALSAIAPAYAPRAARAADLLGGIAAPQHPQTSALVAALVAASHVYVIGRDTGYGAAHEIALKLKECCALHAEAYSASEVLHGPLQLVTRPLLILILDTGQGDIQTSLDTAEARFRAAGGDVHRVRPADLGLATGEDGLTPAAAAALLLAMLYPVVHAVALALGHDPDHPETLSKVTQTR